MKEVQENVHAIETHALHSALAAALGDRLIGISTYPEQPLSIWLDDSADAADQADAAAIAQAHDPVFLSIDKTVIVADGQDSVTVTVRAPKPNAAPVTLLINDVETAITLIDGAGAVDVVSLDPAALTIRLKDGANRYMQLVEVEAR